MNLLLLFMNYYYTVLFIVCIIIINLLLQMSLNTKLINNRYDLLKSLAISLFLGAGALNVFEHQLDDIVNIY